MLLRKGIPWSVVRRAPFPNHGSLGSLLAQKQQCNNLHVSSPQSVQKIKMPSLSPTMSEGQIVKWVVKEGDKVGSGDILCEIQTDKAVVSHEADDDGVVAKIIMKEGSGTILVGATIGLIAEEGEDWKEVAKQPIEGASGEDSEGDGAGQPTGGSTVGIDVNMPSLSPTMQEGTIVKWLVKEGDKINSGDVICDIQTDKAVVSMDWDDEAIMAKILVKEGDDSIPIGTRIALFVQPDEDWKDVQIPAAAPAAASSDKASETAAAPKAESPASGGSPTATTGEHKFPHLAQAGPAVNLLLAQYGIKPSDVEASGPKGLIKSDVVEFINTKGLQPIKISAEQPADSGRKQQKKAAKPTSGYTDHPLSSMRAVIAKRLTDSKQTSPHGHATAAANLGPVMLIRKDYAARGVKVSLNDFIIKAVAVSLQHVPEMNLNVSGEDFQIMPNIDISVAVATDSGLITPIVKNVPAKSLEQISADVKDLAGRAREGKLQLNEFQGGTFTISNLGMFGIHEFTAIINPPQVGILAVGSGSQEVDPITGQVQNIMRSTLSFDRRFIDEALAADFMSTFKTVLERPEFLNLGLPNIVRKDRMSSSN